MKIVKPFLFSLVAPFMIFISIMGLTLRDNNKIFYVPLALMGSLIILEKLVSRKLKRKRILKKIKSLKT